MAATAAATATGAPAAAAAAATATATAGAGLSVAAAALAAASAAVAASTMEAAAAAVGGAPAVAATAAAVDCRTLDQNRWPPLVRTMAYRSDRLGGRRRAKARALEESDLKVIIKYYENGVIKEEDGKRKGDKNFTRVPNLAPCAKFRAGAKFRSSAKFRAVCEISRSAKFRAGAPLHFPLLPLPLVELTCRINKVRN